MRIIRSLTIAISLLLPAVSPANVWTTTCVNITSISNYMANSNEFFITLSSPPSGCNGGAMGVPGAIPFAVGSNGVDSTNINGLLAMALSAYTSGHQVLVAYDNSTNTCYGQAIAVGGYSGQCP